MVVGGEEFSELFFDGEVDCLNRTGRGDGGGGGDGRSR